MLVRLRRGQGLLDLRQPARWLPIRRALRLAAAGGISSALLTSLLIGLVAGFVLLETGSEPIAGGSWLVVRPAALTAFVLEVAAPASHTGTAPFKVIRCLPVGRQTFPTR
jgi:hypothetical protein